LNLPYPYEEIDYTDCYASLPTARFSTANSGEGINILRLRESCIEFVRHANEVKGRAKKEMADSREDHCSIRQEERHAIRFADRHHRI
jgi:hypothetical protein